MMPLVTASRARQFAVSAILGCCLAPCAALAQLTGDQVPRGRTIAAKEQIELELERSRFRLGAIRILPTLEISQAGYDSNVFSTAEEEPIEPVGDWSATVAAGVGWILPVGSKFYLRGNVLPEYTWYKEVKGRRNFGGSYDGALLAFFNRMSLEAGGYYRENFSFLNTETETRVVEKAEGGRGKFEIELTRALSAYAEGELQRLDFRLAGGEPVLFVDVEEFDRTESLARAGLRYRFSEHADLSLASELTQSNFEKTPERDNRTTAILLGIFYGRPRVFLNLVGGYRQGRPFGNSVFREYSSVSGSFFVSFFPRPSLELRLHGSRRPVYGGTAEAPYFLETKGGLTLNVQVFRSLLLRGFGEYGTNDYDFLVPVGDGFVERRDPIRTLGAGFSLILFRNLVFTANGHETEHRSNIPGLQRTVFRVVTAISLRGEFAR